MELVFEVVSAQQFAPGLLTSKTFKQAGGIIGRAENCDWVIPDRKRVLSGQHAQVNYRDGGFFLTDTSSNGIQLKDSGASLRKGQPQRIEHGSVYCLGDFEIRARLIQDPALFEGDIGRAQAAGSIIPDDAFLDLDPLLAIDQQERVYAEVDDFAAIIRPPRSSRITHKSTWKTSCCLSWLLPVRRPHRGQRHNRNACPRVFGSALATR